MNILSIHKSCANIFQRNLFEKENEKGEIEALPYSVACEIYDILTDDSGESCLGDNFNEILNLINDNWFGNEIYYDLQFYYSTYVFWLYLVVARVRDIDKVIEGNTGAFHKKYIAMSNVNRWANFLKHPKHFLFTHFPEYCIDCNPTKKSENIIINDEFLKQYYCYPSQKPEQLENQENVLVVIPDLEKLTQDFCQEFLFFIESINKAENKGALSELRKKSIKKGSETIESIENGELKDLNLNTGFPSNGFSAT